MPGNATERPVRTVADRHDTGESRDANEHPAAGPCERHLNDAIAWCSPLLRAAVIGLCGVFGLIGHASSAAPVAVAILVLATVLPCLQSLWHAVAPVAFMVAGAALSVLVGLSQVVLGAQPVSGWLFATVSITAVTCYWDWPGRPMAGHVLAGVAIAAHGAGCLLADGTVSASGWTLLVQALLAWAGLLLVRHAARLCDQLVRRAERRRIAAAAVRARRTADRAYLAMLHDTASTTLLMVSTDTTGDLGWLPAAARRDLEVLTAYAPVTDDDVDLAGLLSSLATYPGLTVHTELHGPITVPAIPAYAIHHGVGEALSNVRRHAGDSAPELTAYDRDGRVVVRLSDRGAGFDPDAVPAHRRGLAESIHARMTAVGGTAEVRSAPGRGTTVEWTWSRG
ncbi:sensor histidine kinase [Actinophytocola glycyrrhizae]|uniref:Sensor histidine kinase n=1 Tax=Actinophytocola glycyrrhizae TaxID=2044873 RepID=A0ABV9RSX0_9PSEU